jgi:integrase
VGSKRGFGEIQRLSSGRYRARYRGPDLKRHSAPYTFDTKLDAEAWLVDERRLLVTTDWTPPAIRALPPEVDTQLLFGVYAETWLEERPVRPRTYDTYRKVLDRQLLPAFGDTPLTAITAERIRTWHARLGPSRPTIRSHAYSLLRTILGTAVHDGLLAANPCHIRGAGNVKRAHKVEPATLEELEIIVSHLPDRYRLMALFGAWCALRYGELTELRRKDINQSAGVVQVRRAVVLSRGEFIVGRPKTEAGVRDVAIPPHLMPEVRRHLREHVGRQQDALLFPARHGGHMAVASLYRVYYPAREAAGRPDLRWHDLRHTGAVLAAQTGATLAELMGRLGHSTPGAALIYQHRAAGRDHEIARRLSALAQGSAGAGVAEE